MSQERPMPYHQIVNFGTRDMSPEALEKRRIRRRERELEVIPRAYQWADLKAPELDRRVKSKTVIAGTQMALESTFAVWTGPSGSGKTSLACAAIRSSTWLAHGLTLEFVASWRLASARARHPLGDDEPAIVKDALRAGLLLIDDLGSEQAHPTSAVPDVIFDRYERNMPTWYTTGFNPDGIAKRYGDGIARRVFERSMVIDCGAQ